MPEVLLAGVSMRAAAASALRAGFAPCTVDAFRDLDCAGPGTRVALDADGRFDPWAALWKTRGIEASAVVYGSGFEDDPRAVSLLSQGRALWGNAPEVLRAVRSPRSLLGGLALRGYAVPRLFDPAAAGTAAVPPTGVAWLEKPTRSGGGRGIRRWRTGTPIAEGCYLEEFIDGTPGSISFVAAARGAVALGLSRQLAGDPAFGATGYQYCGSIVSHPASLFERGLSVGATAHALVTTLAQDYPLVGLNGLDFIARRGVAYPLEVNPRWSASMELLERAHGISMFRLHASACARGELPADCAALCLRRAVGKAVVFARWGVEVRHARQVLGGLDAADLPRSRTWIRRGQPICTVFAEADDAEACYRRLVEQAAVVYARARDWRPLSSFVSPAAFDV
jgi:predicted ATP-grasp superfamily ATP-dependent carboligase